MSPDSNLKIRWSRLEDRFDEKFGKKPDLETVLMLIGIQELRSSRQKFNKEEKEDLMHIAVCTVLSKDGYYTLKDYDGEGWPHFEKARKLPAYSGKEQEDFLKDHVLRYFENREKEEL